MPSDTDKYILGGPLSAPVYCNSGVTANNGNRYPMPPQPDPPVQGEPGVESANAEHPTRKKYS